MSVAVSVVFTGLCALVPGGERRPAQILLIDARNIGEIGGARLPAHAPTLVASMNTLANAETSAPDRTVAAWPGRGSEAASFPGRGFGVPEQMGIWDLTGSEVTIKVQGGQESAAILYQPPDGGSSWPAVPRVPDELDSWRDLRFIPNMRSLTGDGRIDPSLVSSDDARVASRILLNQGRIEGGIPSQKVFRESLFEFGAPGREPKLRQAVTDTIRWSVVADAPVVVIEIAPRDGGKARRLLLTADVTRHELFISNLPAAEQAGDEHHSMAGDDLAALHFGAYYELLMHPPADRPVPRRWLPPVGRTGTGLAGGTLCPPGQFAY
jgi:hypothetical protein